MLSFQQHGTPPTTTTSISLHGFNRNLWKRYHEENKKKKSHVAKKKTTKFERAEQERIDR